MAGNGPLTLMKRKLSWQPHSRPPHRWVQLHEAKWAGTGDEVSSSSDLEDDAAIDYSEWQETPPPRTKFSSVAYNEKLVIFGGGFQRTFQADLYEHDFKTKKWRCIHTDASLVGGPCRRRSHKVVRRGNQMILFGGRLVYRRRNDVYTLNLDTYKWTDVTPGPDKGACPVERAAHSAVLWRDRMVVFGGDCDSQACLNDLWELNPDTFTWTELKPVGDLPSGRLGHDCAISGDNMYLFGGYQGKALNDMYVLDLAVGRWRAIEHSLCFSARVHPTSFLCMIGQPAALGKVPRKERVASEGADGWPHAPEEFEENVCSALLVFGGVRTNTGLYTDTLYRFDLGAEVFESIEVTGNKPCARLGHSMSIVGDHLYLFGGCQATYYNDMYCLDLSAPSLKHIMRCFVLAEGLMGSKVS